MTTPADELKTAATTLRKLATDAAEDSGTTWHATRYHPDQPDSGFTALWGAERPLMGGGGGRGRPPAYVSAPVGDYIAAMGPNVGALLADWLDETVTEMAAAEGTEYGLPGDSTDFDSWNAALAVARAVNAATRTP